MPCFVAEVLAVVDGQSTGFKHVASCESAGGLKNASALDRIVRM